jgi:hypothetical protein
MQRATVVIIAKLVRSYPRHCDSLVNKIISVPSQPIVNVPSTSDNRSSALAGRRQLEAERIQEVLILLTSLTAREEATIKLIIDCLYDIGAVNAIARTSKPLARILAWRWFKKNCPRLIVNWLYNKVRF